MFLDDKLLMVGRQYNPSMNFAEIKLLVIEMTNICFESIKHNIKLYGHNGRDVILAQFRRVNNTWDKVAEILEKENKGFIQKDDFKALVENRKNILKFNLTLNDMVLRNFVNQKCINQ